MVRTLSLLSAVSAIVVFARAASADTPARSLANAQVIVDADRLMPILSYEAVTFSDPNNSNVSQTLSSFSLALMTTGAVRSFLSFASLPRLGVDIPVASGVTVGASAWVYTELSASLSNQAGGGQSSSTDQPKTTYWGVAPRVGYIVPVTDELAVWPRAGVEYHKFNTSPVTQNNVTVSQGEQVYQFAADVEAALVYTPVHHLGFTFTPYGAIPIVGGDSVLFARRDSAELAVGVTLGLLGYF